MAPVGVAAMKPLERRPAFPAAGGGPELPRPDRLLKSVGARRSGREAADGGAAGESQAEG
jgi:hypothetical protein